MNKSDSSTFYAQLPVIEDFFNASDRQNYHPLPEDWHVAVTDIVNSTAAINENRYKTVNILGASSIVGILNVTDRSKIPYIFGGDGSTFCIPFELLDDAKQVLGKARHIGQNEYNLDLRTAIIPVSYIRERGYDIQVARYQASEFYTQAVFSGGGISYAEEILKDEEITEFQVEAITGDSSVDFSGLECRWQEVQQPGKEVLTLLIKSNPDIEVQETIYRDVLQKMRAIFGFDEKTNPIDASQLTMNLSFSKLMDEAKFRTSGGGLLKQIGYILKVQLQTIIGKVLMALDYKTSATDWSLYKPDMARNSDHRKFDDMLRIVISGTPDQRRELQSYLQQQFEQSRLAYGMHITDAAMITCMVFEYHREHVHFVDGNGGGYVSASKELKKRVEALERK
jgi:hypothetical protein